MEKGVLGKTRKYKQGTIHENASGKFMIIERFMGEDNRPWLKYQWLSGLNEGKIEENKEENINASLYKFRMSRGLKDPIELKPHEIVTPMDNHEKILELIEKMDHIAGIAQERSQKIDQIEYLVLQQNAMVEELTNLVKSDLDNRTLLNKQQELTQKLIEKM
jgi:hypothetical protein